MQRNTFVLRLVVLVGTLVVAAVFLSGLFHTRPGGAPIIDAQLLPPEEMERQLEAAGHDVVSLRREGGLYHVRLADGQLLWVDAGTGQEIAMPEAQGSALQDREVIRLLREAGFEDISSLRWSRGAFEAKATDAQGQRWRLRLDTYSGEVLEREAL